MDSLGAWSWYHVEQLSSSRALSPPGHTQRLWSHSGWWGVGLGAVSAGSSAWGSSSPPPPQSHSHTRAQPRWGWSLSLRAARISPLGAASKRQVRNTPKEKHLAEKPLNFNNTTKQSLIPTPSLMCSTSTLQQMP